MAASVPGMAIKSSRARCQPRHRRQDPLVRRFVGFGTNMVVGGLLLHQVGCPIVVTEHFA